MQLVIIESSARHDIVHHYEYLREHARSPEYPDRWYESIEEAIPGLSDFPLGFGLA